MAELDRDRVREFLKWTDALVRAMDAAVRVDDPNGLWKHSGFKQFARKYNDLVQLIAKEVPLPPVLDLYNVAAIPETPTVCRFSVRRSSTPSTPICCS